MLTDLPHLMSVPMLSFLNTKTAGFDAGLFKCPNSTSSFMNLTDRNTYNTSKEVTAQSGNTRLTCCVQNQGMPQIYHNALTLSSQWDDISQHSKQGRDTYNKCVKYKYVIMQLNRCVHCLTLAVAFEFSNGRYVNWKNLFSASHTECRPWHNWNTQSTHTVIRTIRQAEGDTVQQIVFQPVVSEG